MSLRPVKNEHTVFALLGVVLLSASANAGVPPEENNYREMLERKDAALICVEKSMQLRERLLALRNIGQQSKDSKLKRQALADNAICLKAKIPASLPTDSAPPVIVLRPPLERITAQFHYAKT